MSNAISGIANPVLPVELEGVDPTANSAAAAQRQVNSESATAASQSDQTDLSGAGQVLTRALQTVASLSSFHAESVKELKAKIAAGTYQPDPSSVASAVAKALREA